MGSIKSRVSHDIRNLSFTNKDYMGCHILVLLPLLMMAITTSQDWCCFLKGDDFIRQFHGNGALSTLTLVKRLTLASCVSTFVDIKKLVGD